MFFTRFLQSRLVAVYYDFILTMPQEIKHIWSSKFNLVNVLVIALRYITAFGYVPSLMSLSPGIFPEEEVRMFLMFECKTGQKLMLLCTYSGS